MINGAHLVVYSNDPDADREFFRDTLSLSHVDVGEGWLIFALPPSEIAVHPAQENDRHELYLMCENIQNFIDAMTNHSIEVEKPRDEGWGIVTRLTLPGGGKLGVYEPRHARP